MTDAMIGTPVRDRTVAAMLELQARERPDKAALVEVATGIEHLAPPGSRPRPEAMKRTAWS